jgi:hypothetical protein
MREWLKNLFKRKERIEYYTTDGGHLAPYPNMTDSELKEFENAFNVPKRTFK